MKRIYRENPAYREFKIDTRDDLIDFLNKAKSYIVNLSGIMNGLIGTVCCDLFSADKIGGHNVLSFQTNSNDSTRLLLDGEIEYVDCFCDDLSGTTVMFLKLSGAEREHQILVS